MKLNYFLSYKTNENVLVIKHGPNYFALIDDFKKRVLFLEKKKKYIEVTNNGVRKKNNTIFNNDRMKRLKESVNKNFFDCYHSKIKFKGKSYKMKKLHKNIIKLIFEKSHKTYINFGKSKNIKNRRRFRYLFIWHNLDLLNNLKKMFKAVRPLNIYNKRGIRICKMTVYKKKGKK